MADVAQIQEHLKAFFPGLMGVVLREAEPERVLATLEVRDDLCTLPGILHGGAVMAFADTLGAVGTVLNLGPGEGTTTIESKTNFLAAGRSGTTITGECTRLHRGRRTMVWQTRVLSHEGKLIALVTQTQAVLEAQRTVVDQLGALFAGKSLREQEELLVGLERAGAALYRGFAEQTSDPDARVELERAAEREEANAVTLERLLAK